jgi:hypothetical protein
MGFLNTTSVLTRRRSDNVPLRSPKYFGFLCWNQVRSDPWWNSKGWFCDSSQSSFDPHPRRWPTYFSPSVREYWYREHLVLMLDIKTHQIFIISRAMLLKGLMSVHVIDSSSSAKYFINYRCSISSFHLIFTCIWFINCQWLDIIWLLYSL